MFFREEEREKKESDLRREMEERDKQHRDTVERLRLQVRVDLSPNWIHLTELVVSLHRSCFLFFCFLTVFLQIAQLEKKEPLMERKNHCVKSSLMSLYFSQTFSHLFTDKTLE